MRHCFFVVGMVLVFIAVAFAQDQATGSSPCSLTIEQTPRFAYVSGYRLAEWLAQYKAAEKNDPNASYYPVGKAWGFIAGVVDARSGGIKPPGKLLMKQVVSVVDRYLSKHTDRWHEPAADLVAAALKEHVEKLKANEIK